MNVNTMLTILGLRLEDPGATFFKAGLKRETLEQAQIKLANYLDNVYLTELKYVDEDKTATAGILNFSDLTYKVFKGTEGVLRVKIHDGRYCNQIEIEELEDTTNTLLEGTDKNPMYYVFEEKIYVLCTTADPHIDVFYLRVPSPLYYPLKYTALSGDVESVTGPGVALFDTDLIAHNLEIGDVVLQSFFSHGGYNGEHTVATIPSATTYTTGVAYDSPDDGKFEGLRTVEIQSGQNMVNTDNYYNNSLIYNISKDSYHVITDYIGADLHIVFYPAIAAPADDETIYLLRHKTVAVDITNLANLDPTINKSLHQMMIDMAEAMCWKSGKDERNVGRSKIALEDVLKQIEVLNLRAKEGE